MNVKTTGHYEEFAKRFVNRTLEAFELSSFTLMLLSFKSQDQNLTLDQGHVVTQVRIMCCILCMLRETVVRRRGNNQREKRAGTIHRVLSFLYQN